MTNNTDSLKDYYVKLQGLYENAVNILTAINQSFASNASEITVDIADTDDSVTTVRIPSFLYMENKLEQLENNFSNLFSMPESGSAWFSKSNNMYKLEMVRSNTAPLSPVMNLNNVYASITDNNFLKDLVSPKTFLKIDIDNLPDNIDKMFMKKVVIYNRNLYEILQNTSGLNSYAAFEAAVYNYKNGVDYKEYDSVIDCPIKKDTYQSKFDIVDIPEIDGSSNPWTDTTYNNHKHLSYKLKLNTLEYTDQENLAISFTLKPGDYVCLGNEMVIYKVKNVDSKDNTVILEEIIGHIALQKISENNQMSLTLYNENYGRWRYVNVPLEENQYICIFLGTIYNNVRSLLSTPYFADLSTITMKDINGQDMKDEYGNTMSYLDYYNKYCVNIGDLIQGLTESAYPQVSNYTALQLNNVQNSDQIQIAVSSTIDNTDILQVVPINKHLTNDITSEEIINLHAQKNDLNAQLNTLRDNINETYSKMLNTDFSQDTSVSWQAMQSQINNYYTERTSVQKQLSAVIDNINSKSLDLHAIGSQVKYRIRGMADVETLEALIHNLTDTKCDIIGMDVEYKYKSTSKDTTSLTVINSSTFTDWNKLSTIDRQRHLVFDNTINSYRLEYIDYSKTDNIIKWNQIDIPIQAGEDVVIKVRYKLNVGQPFINIYTPWSDELTVVFPNEFEDDTELKSILDTNRQDTINASFSNTLINEGYQEHISNKVTASDQLFFHMPENIFSGFTTPENNLISLKDKLYSFSQDLEKYKSMIEAETNSKFAIYLNYDDNQVELSPNNTNKINIYNTDHVTGNFIRKEMNIIIKNIGTQRVNLYSIFPGNTNIPLLLTDIEFYNQYIGDYERVPLMVNGEISPQYLGQWIYFRQTNPFTKQNIYYNTEAQMEADAYAAITGDDLLYDSKSVDYICKNNAQVLLGFRKRSFNFLTDYVPVLNSIKLLKDYAAIDTTIDNNVVNLNQEVSDIIDNIIYGKLTPEELEGKETSEAIAKWKKDHDSEYKALINEQMKIYNDNYRNSVIADINKELSKLAIGTDAKYEDKDINWYIYKNSVFADNADENRYLMRYEDICGKNESQQTIFLDSSTSIMNFFSKYHPIGFDSDTDFSGAFLYPNLQTKNTLMTNGAEKDSLSIDAAESISIPVIFEYFLDGNKNTSITKSLYFDIRNSLISNPLHYMIEITGNFDFTATGDIYNNFSNVELKDAVTTL